MLVHINVCTVFFYFYLYLELAILSAVVFVVMVAEQIVSMIIARRGCSRQIFLSFSKYALVFSPLFEG